MVMTIMPRVVSALAGFERVQSYLLRPSLETQITKLSRSAAIRPPLNQSSRQSAPPIAAIQTDQLSIGYECPILENINIKVAPASFTIISGPTGSGKTTLLRAILREIVPTRGSVSLTSEYIAYCAQRPWLPSGTIRDAIYGASNDTASHRKDSDGWYNEVIQICCLVHDINSLPNADQTEVGDNGANLSGGQRQRVVCFPVSYPDDDADDRRH